MSDLVKYQDFHIRKSINDALHGFLKEYAANGGCTTLACSTIDYPLHQVKYYRRTNELFRETMDMVEALVKERDLSQALSVRRKALSSEDEKIRIVAARHIIDKESVQRSEIVSKNVHLHKHEHSVTDKGKSAAMDALFGMSKEIPYADNGSKKNEDERKQRSASGEIRQEETSEDNTGGE